ncbi:MAG: hypothetical protein JXX14_12205 [Deltaproteobacteria bacterium]|nr:hypothetical protein [Deltaproteobacteria bacterium]
MINTAHLQRLDRASVEAKAARFAGVLCLLLWMAFGVTVRLWIGDWYGFGVGFIVAALLSVLAMWILYVRPTARERLVVRASWRGSAFKIYDPIDKNTETIDFSKKHKAILISSKAERQFLLRLSQTTGDMQTRIDIIGPLPMALPMPVTGEASSLFGFYGKAKAQADGSKPYRLKEVADRESLCRSLLAFVESYRSTRDGEIRIKKDMDIIRWRADGFSLVTPDREVSFSGDVSLGLSFMARTTRSTAAQHGKKGIETTEILIALYPLRQPADALVFATIATPLMADELSQSWDIPDSAMHRKFTLYDDSVNSFVFSQTLKEYIKKLAPNAAVLDVLRR